MFEAEGSVMPVWAITRVDPGYLYAIKSEGRYKLGKTASALRRFRAAKTWLPDMELVGYKPFWGISHHERLLHIGLAPYWYSGEWFDFAEYHDARDYLLDGFRAVFR